MSRVTQIPVSVVMPPGAPPCCCGEIEQPACPDGLKLRLSYCGREWEWPLEKTGGGTYQTACDAWTDCRGDGIVNNYTTCFHLVCSSEPPYWVLFIGYGCGPDGQCLHDVGTSVLPDTIDAAPFRVAFHHNMDSYGNTCNDTPPCYEQPTIEILRA